MVVRPSSRAVALSRNQWSARRRRSDSILLHRDALAVERMRAQAAQPQRIVDDADAGANNLLAELVLQEAGLARDRGAVDRADEMADQRARDPRDRTPPARSAVFDLARIEPCAPRARRPCGRSLRALRDRYACSAEDDRSRAPCRCLRRQSRSSRCCWRERDRSRESRRWSPAPCRRCPPRPRRRPTWSRP